MAKPDARIYRLTLARLGVPAHHALFVNDAPCHVSAARQIGR